MWTSLRALSGQSGVEATLETPTNARSRSMGSRSGRISPLSIARCTRELIAPLIKAPEGSNSLEGFSNSVLTAGAMSCLVAM